MIAPSWVRYGSLHGWMWRGAIPAKELVGAGFWAQAARVACSAEGGSVDMVQCYDAGIFTAGPLGMTARFGTLAKLVAEVPSNVRLKYLGPLAELRGLGLREGPGAVFTVGLRTATPADFERVFLGGADLSAWAEADEEAQLAREWVVAFAEMLTDPAARRGVTTVSANMLKSYLAPEAAKLFGFGPVGAPEPVKPDAKRAMACHLAFAINNPKGALKVLQIAGPDADRILDAAGQPGAWPSTFPQRVARTRAALATEAW